MNDPSFVRRSIRALRGYVPGEQPRDQTYIKLNTNENPYPPSPRVLDAIRGAISADLRLYPDPASTALRTKAAQVYGLLPNQILAGNGSDDLIAMVIRACADPGATVAYATPTYSLYETLVDIQGARSITVPFPSDFRLPLDALAALGSPITFVCNPNSPSGTFTPVSELDFLAKKVSGLLVIDEAYVDFASDTALSLVDKHDNIVVLRTFSKSFSLCGMRIGLAFGSAGVMAEIEKVKDSYNVGRLGEVSGVAALDDIAWMQANAAKICATRTTLVAGLERLGFSVPPSHANFVLARRAGRDMAPVLGALKKKGVLVRHFATPDLYDALRITVGTDPEVATLLERLSDLAP